MHIQGIYHLSPTYSFIDEAMSMLNRLRIRLPDVLSPNPLCIRLLLSITYRCREFGLEITHLCGLLFGFVRIWFCFGFRWFCVRNSLLLIRQAFVQPSVPVFARSSPSPPFPFPVHQTGRSLGRLVNLSRLDFGSHSLESERLVRSDHLPHE